MEGFKKPYVICKWNPSFYYMWLLKLKPCCYSLVCRFFIASDNYKPHVNFKQNHSSDWLTFFIFTQSCSINRTNWIVELCNSGLKQPKFSSFCFSMKCNRHENIVNEAISCTIIMSSVRSRTFAEIPIILRYFNLFRILYFVAFPCHCTADGSHLKVMRLSNYTSK